MKSKNKNRTKIFSLALGVYLMFSTASIPKIISEELHGAHTKSIIKSDESISESTFVISIPEKTDKPSVQKPSAPSKKPASRPKEELPAPQNPPEETILPEDETKEEITDIPQEKPEDKPSETPDDIPAPEETPPEPEKDEETEENAITVTATAYCGCYDCNGQWTGYPAADGTPLRSWHTIAADEKFAFGTEVYIPYFSSSPNGGYFRVSDRGGAITGNRIDIYFSSHSEATAFGIKELEMYVVG